jgi:hypothetical protein
LIWLIRIPASADFLQPSEYRPDVPADLEAVAMQLREFHS